MSGYGKFPEERSTKFGGTHNASRTQDHRITRILDVIEDNPMQTVDGLSAITNLSVSRLTHLFKESTGVSLSRYLSDRQLEEAARLLSSTELQVKQVSFHIGYSHEPSFVRAFRNKFGSSPTDFRKAANCAKK